MALSLPSERSVAAGSQVNPIRALVTRVTRALANRRRQTALVSLLDLDDAHLRDLGITRLDIAEAMNARKGRTPGMVLNAARARNSRA